MSLMAQRASSAESACERRAAAAGWQVALAAAKFAERGFRLGEASSAGSALPESADGRRRKVHDECRV